MKTAVPAWLLRLWSWWWCRNAPPPSPPPSRLRALPDDVIELISNDASRWYWKLYSVPPTEAQKADVDADFLLTASKASWERNPESDVRFYANYYKRALIRSIRTDPLRPHAFGRIDVIASLLRRSSLWMEPTCDVDATYSVLFYACVSPRPDVLKLLIDGWPHHGDESWPQPDLVKEALLYAVENGHRKIVRMLLGWPGVAPRADAWDGEALVRAAELGRSRVVKTLLGCPTHAPRVDAQGGKALVLAAKHGHVNVVRLLLLDWPDAAAGARIHALHQVIEHRSPPHPQSGEVLRLLLDLPNVSKSAASRIAGNVLIHVIDPSNRYVGRTNRYIVRMLTEYAPHIDYRMMHALLRADRRTVRTFLKHTTGFMWGVMYAFCFIGRLALNLRCLGSRSG